MPENNFKAKIPVKPAMGAHEKNVDKGLAKQIRRDLQDTTVGRLNKPVKGQWDAPQNAKMKYEAGCEPSGTNPFAPKFKFEKRKDGSTGMC